MDIQKISIVLMLAIGSIWDVREKKIPGELLAVYVLSGVLLMILNQGIDWKKEWYLYALGILIGMIILLAGRFCGGCIGTADGIMLMIIGGLIGYRDTLFLLMCGVLMAAVCSILLIALRRAGRKTTIPFFPFMLLGYLMIIGGGL